MKNIIISILATVIFYTQFCEVKMPMAMPFFALLVFLMLAEVDCLIDDYKRTIRRGEKLQHKLKQLEGGFNGKS